MRAVLQHGAVAAFLVLSFPVALEAVFVAASSFGHSPYAPLLRSVEPVLAPAAYCILALGIWAQAAAWIAWRERRNGLAFGVAGASWLFCGAFFYPFVTYGSF